MHPLAAKALLAVLLQHCGGPFEERAVSVQENRGIAARILRGTGDTRMFENLGLPGFLLGEYVARPFSSSTKSNDRNVAGGIRVSFLKPSGAAIFGLKNVQNLLADSGNCFSLLAHGEQGPLNSLVFAAESLSRRADASARIVPRIARSAPQIGRSCEVESLTRRFDFHFCSATTGARTEPASSSETAKIFAGAML